MRRAYGAILIALAALPACPAAAQETDFAGMSDAELQASMSRERLAEEPCEIVPAAVELRSRHPDDDRLVGMELMARMACAGQREDYAEAAQHAAELARRFPDELNFKQAGLFFEMKLEDGDAILARFQSMDVAQLAQMNDELFWAGVRMLGEQGKEADLNRAILKWYDDGGLGLFDPRHQNALALRAIRAAMKADRPDAVTGILAFVRSPNSYITLLADRDYSLAWPQIEELAGDNLEPVSRSYAEATLARLEAGQDDPERLSGAMHALYYAGRFQNVIALSQPLQDRLTAGEEIEEDEAWAANIRAYAYDALGERQKADAVFQALSRISPADHYWVVNFVINAASRLIGQGRWEEGLRAAALAREVASEYGSPYARMIIARDHACALPQVGRKDEVAEELTFLRENSDKAADLAAQGLMCNGERAEAASVLIAGLEDENARSRVIEALQPAGFELFYTPSILPQPHDLLAESEALRQIFERYGRIIPQRFEPIANRGRRGALQPDRPG